MSYFPLLKSNVWLKQYIIVTLKMLSMSYRLFGVTLLNVYPQFLMDHFEAAIRGFNSFCNNLNRIDLLEERCLQMPCKKYHCCIDLIVKYILSYIFLYCTYQMCSTCNLCNIFICYCLMFCLCLNLCDWCYVTIYSSIYMECTFYF